MDATRNPADKPSAPRGQTANRAAWRKQAGVRCEFFLTATSCKVSQRRIRLAAYVTRLERVRGSRPSWVQIPHPPPEKIPVLGLGFLHFQHPTYGSEVADARY